MTQPGERHAVQRGEQIVKENNFFTKKYLSFMDCPPKLTVTGCDDILTLFSEFLFI
jgi:hypothetical protein